MIDAKPPIMHTQLAPVVVARTVFIPIAQLSIYKRGIGCDKYQMCLHRPN
jgi:hypothetical protein